MKAQTAQAQRVAIVRESIDKIVGMLTMRSIRVTQQGVRAYVEYDPTGNPRRVNIPYLPDTASDEFISSVQGFLDHEVAHVLFTDSAAINKKLRSMSKVPRDQVEKLKSLFNIIEDVRIERVMAQRFPGSGHNLSTMVDFFLKSMVGPAMQQQEAAGQESGLRANVLMVATRKWAGQSVAKDFIAADPALTARVEELENLLGDEIVKKIATIESSLDAFSLAQGVLQRIKDQAAQPPSGQDDGPPGEQPNPGDKSEGDDSAAGKSKSAPSTEEGSDNPEGEGPQPQGEEGPQTDPESEDGGSPQAATENDAGTGTEDEDEEETGAGNESASDPEAESDPREEEGNAETRPGEDGDQGEGEDQPQPASAEDPSAADEDGETGDGGSDGGDSDDDAPPADECGNAGSTSETEDPASQEQAEESSTRERQEAQATFDSLDNLKSTDEVMSDLLTKEATENAKSADYIVYTTEFDRFDEGELAKDPDSIARMVDKVQHMVGPMQRQLERALLSRVRKGWVHNTRRGRLSHGALFKAQLNDDRVFRQRYEVSGKGTAVSLAVDCSGSMLSDGALVSAAQTAYALSSTLARLRIPHEIIGFTTLYEGEMKAAIDAEKSVTQTSIDYSRIEPLNHVLLKRFSDRLETDAISRLARLTEADVGADDIGRCNIDGESIAFIGHRLLMQKAERHVLLVLSDGQPAGVAAHGLREHLRRVVIELEAMGVETVGIGIQSDAVRSYYAKHVVLDDVRSLPKTIIKKLEEILLAE